MRFSNEIHLTFLIQPLVVMSGLHCDLSSKHCAIQANNSVEGSEQGSVVNIEKIHPQHVLFESFEVDSMLAPFNSLKCLIFLRNFLLLDISGYKIPTLIQYFEPIREDGSAFRKWTQPKSKSRNSLGLLDCISSSNYYGTHRVSLGNRNISRCEGIKMSKWLLHSRPWNCEVRVDILNPHLFGRDRLPTYPTSGIYNFPLHQPATFPTIHVLLHKHYKSEYRPSLITDGVSLWMRSTFSSTHKDDKIGNSAVFLVQTFRNLSKTHLTCEGMMEIWQFDNDYSSKAVFLYSISMLQWPHFGLKEFQAIKRFSEAETKFWDVAQDSDDHIMKAIYNCTHTITKTSFTAAYLAGLDVEFRVGYAFAHVLQVIMNNFTYRANETHACKYPGVLVTNPRSTLNIPRNELVPSWSLFRFEEPHRIPSPSLVFNNSMLNLGFVACGQRNLAPFPYYELTNVFDNTIWLGLIAICLITSFLFYLGDYNIRYKSNRNSCNWLFHIHKILVEQGNPFPSLRGDAQFQRSLFACLCLFGIVLSNAYKNTNVYRMSQKRDRYTFNTIERLYKHNFTIYSRIGTVEHFVLTDLLSNVLHGYWMTQHFDNGHHIAMTLDPVFSVSIESELKANADNSVQNNGLLQRSRLHPNATLEIQRTLLDINQFKLEHLIEMLQNINKIVKKKDEEKLLDALAQCSNTAVFLPVPVAIRYKLELERHHDNIVVDLSKRQHGNVLLGIQFKGIIPYSVPDKIRGLQTSGIIRWWEQISTYDQKVYRNYPERVGKASLSGNIFIVFTVLWAGQVMAFLTYILEEVAFLL